MERTRVHTLARPGPIGRTSHSNHGANAHLETRPTPAIRARSETSPGAVPDRVVAARRALVIGGMPRGHAAQSERSSDTPRAARSPEAQRVQRPHRAPAGRIVATGGCRPARRGAGIPPTPNRKSTVPIACRRNDRRTLREPSFVPDPAATPRSGHPNRA